MKRQIIRKHPQDGANEKIFSILQFNVLAHCLCDGETPEAFTTRRQLNADHVASLRPSICLMQEVDAEDVYLPELDPLGYKVVCEAKASDGHQDCLCVWYREEEVTMLAEARRVNLDKAIPGSSQFALLCPFQLKSNGKKLLFVGQHAKAGRTEEAETKRLTQAKELHEAIASFIADFGEPLPLIWAGDMNASDSDHGGKYPCRWYKAAVLGEETVIADGEAPWKCPRKMVSAVVDASGREPAFTTCKMRNGKLLCHTIDYVLLEQGHFQCVAHFEDIDQEAIAPTYLPHPQWGSDHLSVYVEISC